MMEAGPVIAEDGGVIGIVAQGMPGNMVKMRMTKNTCRMTVERQHRPWNRCGVLKLAYIELSYETG
jgi:hypothetical protein